jgi:hypothetical protein
MSAILKAAMEQGFAFLCGLGLVTLIRPTTTGGALLLIVITMAALNAGWASYLWFRQRWTSRSLAGEPSKGSNPAGDRENKN